MKKTLIPLSRIADFYQSSYNAERARVLSRLLDEEHFFSACYLKFRMMPCGRIRIKLVVEKWNNDTSVAGRACVPFTKQGIEWAVGVLLDTAIDAYSRKKTYCVF